MIPLISIPARMIRLLKGNTSPREVAFGVCLAMFFGFVPLNGPITILLVIFFLLIKLNRLSTILTLPVFKLIYILGLSSVCDRLGGVILIDAAFTEKFWRIVTHMPLLAYLNLNNTLVAGGVVLSAILCLPVYLVSKRVFIILRGKYSAKLKNSKFVKTFMRIAIADRVATFTDKIKGQDQ